MAGKSNKARNKKAAQVAAAAANAVVAPRESVIPDEALPVADVVSEEAPKVESEDTVAVEDEAVTAAVEASQAGGVSAESQAKQGDIYSNVIGRFVYKISIFFFSFLYLEKSNI